MTTRNSNSAQAYTILTWSYKNWIPNWA